MLAGVAASLLAVAPSRAPRPAREPLSARFGRWALVVLAAIAVALTTLVSMAYDGGYLGGEYLGYGGGYILMGIHVYLLQIAVPLVAIAAAVATRRPGTPPPPPDTGANQDGDLTPLAPRSRALIG